MFAVRFHGRGGQGVVTAAELLAPAVGPEPGNTFGQGKNVPLIGLLEDQYPDHPERARLTAAPNHDSQTRW